MHVSVRSTMNRKMCHFLRSVSTRATVLSNTIRFMIERSIICRETSLVNSSLNGALIYQQDSPTYVRVADHWALQSSSPTCQ